MENPSRLGIGYRADGCDVAVNPPAPEWGESLAEDGVISSVRILRKAVADVMGDFAPGRDFPTTHTAARLGENGKEQAGSDRLRAAPRA